MKRALRKLLPAFVAFALFGRGLAAQARTTTTPVSYVDPFVGTSGTPVGGPIDDFPGADVPFGMLQWSPDTPSQNAGGGYEFNDTTTTGLSLTHLSGPGCNVFGDFAVLPLLGAPPNALQGVSQPFSHVGEIAAPGYYAVTLGKPGIRAELTVTSRSGLARFTFPQSHDALLTINPASDQAGVSTASIRIVGTHELEASARSGHFCGMPDRFTVYMAARFNRPFAASGLYENGVGRTAGAWLRFDSTKRHSVRMQVAISFVSERGAWRNLRTSARSWSIVEVRDRALQRWNRALGHVRVSGGSTENLRTFYSALYHTMLHPNLFSDVDGRYRGFDGKVHRVAPGHAFYANFSDWDIYRTEIPLLALLFPHRTSDMMQSLVDAAEQDAWLPRWALANAPTSVMGGDSVDPVIAGAYAFGARDFSVHRALAAMVKGANDTTAAPAFGWYQERPAGGDFNELGYIPNVYTTSVSPVPNGASETLEYSLDDFSISAFARALDQRAVADAFLKNSANWSNLFDRSLGEIAPRGPGGAFERTQIGDNGQSGFQEGNAAQYTWMVPQDLRDLFRGMGGRAAARKRLDTFFTHLNAGQSAPYAWLGNEPSIGSPWAYLSAGAPWREERVIRAAMTRLWGDRPDGLPGNDDLGTMSAWYVWSALGLYPQNPAERYLDIGAPLFTHAVITPSHGPVLTIDAPQAGADAPYVQRVSVNGRVWNRPWIALPQAGTLHLSFALGARPNRSWGSARADAPPSYAPAGVQFPASTAMTLVRAPGGFTILNPGAHAHHVTWSTAIAAPARVTPRSGALLVPAGGRASVALSVANAGAPAGLYDIHIIARAGNGARFPSLLLYRTSASGADPDTLAWLIDRSHDSVIPFDLRTQARGAALAVGKNPLDAVLSRDNRMLFVGNRGGDSVSAIDTMTRRVIATIPVKSPDGLALSAHGNGIWVANYRADTVERIDVATLKVGASIAVGKHPRWIAVAPDGSRIYVTDQGANSVTPIDLQTQRALPAVAVGREPTGIAISPDGRTLYVANNRSDDVSVLDAATLQTLAVLPAGAQAQMVAISPNGRLAYVPNLDGISVTPIDLTTRRVLPDIFVGGAPFEAAFTPGGASAYVIDMRDNALVRIDVARGSAGSPLLYAPGIITIAMPHGSSALLPLP
uniref:Alpha-1,2-mannosidase n=1 Tax=mine drainage metagenome TaxID=410659 RepID=E6PGX8_9ZZZZ